VLKLFLGVQGLGVGQGVAGAGGGVTEGERDRE
jgi:hypothetical protein